MAKAPVPLTALSEEQRAEASAVTKEVVETARKNLIIGLE
jgi:hypothetical protein